MDAIEFHEIFNEDLGDSFFSRIFSNGDEKFESHVWLPIKATDGTWGCKCLIIESNAESVSVHPSDDKLRSLINAIFHIDDREKNSNITLSDPSYIALL